MLNPAFGKHPALIARTPLVVIQIAVIFCAIWLLPANSIHAAAACPFCSAINLPFTEQMASNDIVVIGKLLEVPPPSDDPDAELPRAKFEIVKVLKGDRWVDLGMKFRTLLVGKKPIGEEFLVMGVDPPQVTWSTPMKSSDRVIDYLTTVRELPESGPKRLTFFQNYFEDEESVLAFDAYDEFARAPYEDLVAMKDEMNHDQLVSWIKSTKVSSNRRRLYFTMLGVCGNKTTDVEMLEELITSVDRKKRAGLNALLACYLNLKGADGVSLLEKTFIEDTQAEYTDTLAAIEALRFHGTELEIVPRERIIAAIRKVLDRPKMADMIIPDLARWEDWSVMDRLVTMFKEADEETNWLRIPVITYLRACPKPEAKKHIEELAKIDPESIRRADFFLDFSDPEGETEKETADESETKDADKEEKPAADGDDGSGGKNERDNEDGNDEKKLAVDSFVSTPVCGWSEEASNSNEKAGSEEGPAEASDELTHTVRRVPMQPEGTTNQDIPAAESVNSQVSSFVSDNGDSTPEMEQLAQTTVPTVATAGPASVDRTMVMIFVPLLASVGIFLLLWSVINGWFERLIF